uniref:Ubiquitin-like domain-containing protein n=1 Tax=Timspurckia oligopyrenoides TaxID=708627 RepID=A0A7S0ZD19_9RHOD|mmetsp:Transcript_1299/g.2390  ORF Transcript_1299/g.2390 Transcript_1299/m.2390 type:complete len:118 (+) Transcript_1299:72-425(+)|eukprot:CAMPEP_0182446700 /NCGR_PEP_ID=MMETSP1172-20130603/4681_1 /TAXON_ID=708627 /ORGANISM="Timspurckia oligopyrenoides, Strain CCMP3278" /LENGTH=117 /DNA_ID=CAMNT_0024642693 /DNA_START=33 /DNA_END=386 /DNA_ORIENTATION=+
MEETTDVKPKKEESGAGGAGEAEQINIKVKDSDGNEVQFKIKRSTPLSKLMQAYSQRLGAQQDTFRFMFDGKRVQTGDTPDSLDMDDGDCIDAMIYQQGGGMSHRNFVQMITDSVKI